MDFKQIVRKNFDEWETQGFCQEAVNLNKNIGEDYFDTAQPHFFTGDIHSKLVLVHLNPKRNKNIWGKKCEIDFADYWENSVHFGKKVYGKNSPRTHKSPFDHKQVRFLKPFGILPFKNDVYHNLEVVIDQKLQLELVPFGSPNFNYHKIGAKNLQPFIERLLNLINESKREYIIFCGRIFQEILKDYIVKEKTHSFYLTKNDGNPTQAKFEVINIKLKYNDLEVTACIAPQYAKQGYPVCEYGKAVCGLYGKFDKLLSDEEYENLMYDWEILEPEVTGLPVKIAIPVPKKGRILVSNKLKITLQNPIK